MFYSLQRDLQYRDARATDTDETKSTNTTQTLFSPPCLTQFSGSSRWLCRLPPRSRQTISSLILVDTDPHGTSDCFKTLSASLRDFSALKSLHVQAGSSALIDRLSPAAAMVILSENVPWLEELTLCYYDHCPCTSLAFEVSFSLCTMLQCSRSFMLMVCSLLTIINSEEFGPRACGGRLPITRFTEE